LSGNRAQAYIEFLVNDDKSGDNHAIGNTKVVECLGAFQVGREVVVAQRKMCLIAGLHTEREKHQRSPNVRGEDPVLVVDGIERR
jgi:hypothetical protein